MFNAPLRATPHGLFQTCLGVLLGSLVLAAVVTAQAPVIGNVVMFEDFEGAAPGALPDGWKVSRVSASPDFPHVVSAPAGIQPRSGGKVLMVNRTVGENLSTSLSYVDFGPVEDRVVVSFWVYVTSHVRSLNVSLRGTTPDEKDTLFRPNSDSSLFLTLNTSRPDVNIRSFNRGGGWTDGPVLTRNTWHKVTLDINVRANTFDVYLNDSATQLKDVPFVNATRALTGLSFGYQSVTGQENEPGPVYIDDLAISY